MSKDVLGRWANVVSADRSLIFLPLQVTEEQYELYCEMGSTFQLCKICAENDKVPYSLEICQLTTDMASPTEFGIFELTQSCFRMYVSSPAVIYFALRASRRGKTPTGLVVPSVEQKSREPSRS